MRPFDFFLTIFALSLLCPPSAYAQRIGAAPVRAELNMTEIFEGQSVVATVTLRSLGSSEPKPVGFDDFKVERYQETRTKTMISPGRRFTEVQYRFLLTPKETGQLTVPPFVVEYDGKTYTSKTLRLNVKTADEQDTIYLTQFADRESVYPAQSFEVSLVVQVKSLDNAPRRNPLEINALMRRVRSPHLTIPWLSDDDLPTGLVPRVERESVVAPLRNDQQVGFRINDIPAQRMRFLDLIDRVYMPVPERVTTEDAQGQQAMYWQFVFRRRLIGTLPGTYTLEPCIGKGEFAKTLRSNPGLQNVFVRSNDLTVTVMPAPEEGRPDNYINVSGSITGFTSEVNPKRASVGDPLTLTLRLRGTGTMDEASAPDLAGIPAMSRNFRLLEPTSEIIGGERVFTYSLRPLSAQVSEIPPIEASYFDIVKEKYVPISTEPVPLEVSESQRLNSSQIVSNTPNGTNTVDDEIELSEDGLFGNATDIESFQHDRVQPMRWFAAWGGTLSAYTMAWLLMIRRKKADADPLRSARRNAPATAESHLAAARSALSQNDSNRATNEIRESFAGILASVTGQTTAGMTPREVHEKLVELELPAESANRIRDLLEKCEAGRYGASQIGSDEVDEAGRLLSSLTTELGQRGLLS